MSKSLKPYIDALEHCLEESICIRTFPSQICERQSKPEVEVRTSKELLFEPIRIRRSENESCLIESSINSVRVSFRFKDADPIEKVLGKKYLRFFMKRAEDFTIMRRVPVKGYSFSFLITSKHVDQLTKKKIINFILHFVVDVDKEISSLKIAMNARGRAIATEYMKLYS